MLSDILVDGLGLTYKGSMGISTATIPDVCKTPSPSGPVPVPYPNIARQSSLQKGTTTVKAHGKMIAVKGSQYGRSNGDEAGTAGGVKSGVNMKATDWITYSFDVKMDGQNACRHTDKKFHNNQNAVNLAGNIDPNNPPPGLTPKQRALWKPCIEQHDKYKAIQAKEANHRTNEFNQLKAKALEERKLAPAAPRLLSQAERSLLQQINNEKIVMLEELCDERERYIDMDCDDIPWPNSKHPTAEARRQSHYGELYAMRARLSGKGRPSRPGKKGSPLGLRRL
ncbi:DUF4150 domain-containing protein [Pseudomonas chlororaphis subsp. aurantiaca]|uniref:DUF4150 domain-containing protein n=1 Tax=Pseudomonas chlororaphis TaxID=587753 RepID=UPI0027DE71AA|nr:DUF4150 domain-containing protein [Pseudomonas chlororaphis]WMJ02458.1 DUF4150 domain-containing protein [Pseudomonas chlororaphis subsp. aurantiaca]